MKYLKSLACAIVVLSFLLTGIGCQQEAKGPQEMKLFGGVQKSPNGIIIMSEGKSYLVEGQDLTPMVGKMVEANGTVSQKDGKWAIAVASVTESKK